MLTTEVKHLRGNLQILSDIRRSKLLFYRLTSFRYHDLSGISCKFGGGGVSSRNPTYMKNKHYKSFITSLFHLERKNTFTINFESYINSFSIDIFLCLQANIY